MSNKRVYAIFIRQMFLLKGNWTRFVNIFAWILIDIVIWGFITKFLNSIGSEINFTPIFLGAIILWNFLIRVQQGIILAFFEDVWSRNFMNLFASPLKVTEYISGLVLTCLVTSSAGLLVMLIVASFAFGFILLQFGFFLIPFILILLLMGLALGIFTSAIVVRYGPSAEWIAWPMPFFLQPFAGVFYPIAILPVVFQAVSKLVPASYAFENMRSFILTGTVSMQSLGIGLLLAFLYVVLAYIFFVRIYHHALRNGLIARFAAGADF